MKKKKILFLGATGRIGPTLLEKYSKDYKNCCDIILGIHKKKSKKFKSIKTDLNDIRKLKTVMKGIDVVVNLAAESNPEASFEEILQPNLIGAYNVFEAARQAKVKRVIFASSVHAVRGYPLNSKIKNTDVTWPKNLYGASKVFGESLCRVFSTRYEISCLAIRIGAYVTDDMRKKVCLTRDNFGYVITQSDFAQLIHKCVIALGKIKFGVLSGISNNEKGYMDLEFTKKLVGYKPKNDAVKICNKLVGKHGKRNEKNRS